MEGCFGASRFDKTKKNKISFSLFLRFFFWFVRWRDSDFIRCFGKRIFGTFQHPVMSIYHICSIPIDDIFVFDNKTIANIIFQIFLGLKKGLIMYK